MIDAEIKTIIGEQYSRARTLLEEHREVMHSIVAVLLEHETLTGEEFQILLEGGDLPNRDSEPEKSERPENTPERPAPQIKLKPA
jgi:Peptidase family M41